MSDFNPQDDTREKELNPSAQNYEDRFNDAQSSLRSAQNSANSSDKRQLSNDGSTGDQEKNVNPLGAASDIKTSFTGDKLTAAMRPYNTKVKKKGALTGIIVLLLGIAGIGTTLFTPGLGIVQMKEVLTGNLNDQLAAMDIRSESVFRAKLSNMSSGVCTGVQIKCKFTSISQKQVDRFKKAGFVIPEDGIKDGKFGRKIITSMTAPDGTVIKNPADLTKARKTNMDVRSALNRVYNPTYYGLADKVANTFFTNNKTGKQKKITGDTDEDRKKAMTDATAGEKAQGGGVLKDRAGRQYIMDSDGQPVYADDKPDRFNELKKIADDQGTALNGREKVGGKAVGGVLLGAAKGVSVLGATDSACTVYNIARAVAAAAKTARAMQLVQLAMVVNSTADSIKAGDATDAETAFLGEKLAATDNRQKVLNEKTGELENNPQYGDSAYDSAGFKVASYNEAPTLNLEAQQYMVGGGLSGTLSGVMADVSNTLGGPEGIRNTCKFVQSPWVRGAGLIIGVFAAIGSFGTATIVSIAASATISLAQPFLESMLVDIVTGSVVNGDTASVDMGNAAFAGSAAILGGVAMMRGMSPMNKAGLKSYLAATAETTSDMIAYEKHEAAKTPLDVMNQYSFLGSFARNLYPTALVAKSSVSGAVASVGSVVSKGFASLMKPVSATQVYNDDRFSKCNDPGYTELGIDADIFCNVRYGLTPAELVMDTEVVVDFMLEKDYISDSGTPQGNYAEFMKNCANRIDGWGDTSEENGNIGLECIDGTGSTYQDISYFRIYTLDSTITDGMDDEDTDIQQLSSGEFVLPVDPGYKISSPWGPRSCNGCSKFHLGIDMTNYPGGSKGKPVYSIADGEVIMADKGNGNGTICQGGMSRGGNNLVKVKHANGTISGYWHMAPGDITVSVGDTVTAGQKIGAINNCGQSFGAHLHFTIWPGDTTDPNILAVENKDGQINPTPFMALFGVDTVNGVYTDGR